MAIKFKSTTLSDDVVVKKEQPIQEPITPAVSDEQKRVTDELASSVNMFSTYPHLKEPEPAAAHVTATEPKKADAREPITPPAPANCKKTPLYIALGFLMFGLTAIGFYGYEQSRIVQPTNLVKEGSDATVTMHKQFGDFVVWEVAGKDGSYKYYPIADKKGNYVVLGTMLDVKTNKPIFDSSMGAAIADEESSNTQSNTAAQPQQATEEVGEVDHPTPPAQSKIPVSDKVEPISDEDIPETRWGSTFSNFGPEVFGAKHSAYGDKGLPDDYFTKSMVGSTDGAGFQAAGAGEFKADVDVFSRHVAETLSRESSHSGLKNKDVMANPQNYVWIFHKYDCGYCRMLINGIGTRGNVVYIPLVNNIGDEEFDDTLTTSNTVKSIAQLEGLHNVFDLENMDAGAVSLPNKDYNKSDLDLLRYNTSILEGLHQIMEQAGYRFPKTERGGFTFGTPTAIYFDRETGKANVSYMMADEKERARVLGF